MAGRGRSKRYSRTGLARVGGDVLLAGWRAVADGSSGWGGDGGHHRPSRRRRPWGYAPAAASSAIETSRTFPSCTVLWASLESAEEVEVYELYHVALADGRISLTKEVVVDGRYDLDRAVVVGVVPNDQRVRGVNFAKIQPKDLEIVVGDVPQSLGNAPGQLVAAEVQEFQVGEAAQLPGDRPSQPVVAEVQEFQVGEVAQFPGDPGQLVAAEVQGFQVGEVAQLPPNARWEYAGILSGDIIGEEIPAHRAESLAYSTIFMRILAGCYHDWMGQEDDWNPLANYLKRASLETGGGHGTLMVDAGAMLPEDTVPSGRRQEVEGAIKYIVQQAGKASN